VTPNLAPRSPTIETASYMPPLRSPLTSLKHTFTRHTPIHLLLRTHGIFPPGQGMGTRGYTHICQRFFFLTVFCSVMDIYLFRFSLLFFPHLLDNPPVCSVLNCVPFSQLQTTTRYPNTSPCVSLSLSSTSLRTSTQLECEHDVTQGRILGVMIGEISRGLCKHRGIGI